MDGWEDRAGEKNKYTVQMEPEMVMTHAESEGMVTQGSLKDVT